MIFVTVPRQSYTNILLRPNCKASPAVLTHCTDHLTKQHIYAILLCYTDSETTGEYDGYIPDSNCVPMTFTAESPPARGQ